MADIKKLLETCTREVDYFCQSMNRALDETKSYVRYPDFTLNRCLTELSSLSIGDVGKLAIVNGGFNCPILFDEPDTIAIIPMVYTHLNESGGYGDHESVKSLRQFIKDGKSYSYVLRWSPDAVGETVEIPCRMDYSDDFVIFYLEKNSVNISPGKYTFLGSKLTENGQVIAFSIPRYYSEVEIKTQNEWAPAPLVVGGPNNSGIAFDLMYATY